MSQKCRMGSIMLLLMVSLVVASPAVSAGTLAACGADLDHSPAGPERLALLWLKSLDRFIDGHPDLSPGDLAAIREAAALGDPAFFAGGNWAMLDSTLRRMEKSLSRSDLGEIFSRMGSAQRWLVEAKLLAAPYCNCPSLGATCVNHPGTCKVGCISWEQQTKGAGAGTAYVGICSD
jgi:hypothetical protein